MPMMLPSVVDPATPASERRVFEALSLGPNTSKWTVLHSLSLSSAYTGEYGEIDFVVLIPGAGIVCIEVKGGGVRNDSGQWSTTAPGGEKVPLKRSPFAQAFERVPVATTTRWDVETRMRALTEEQYSVLDGISDNRDCLVHGGAGTGKTLLAIEAARRAAASGGRPLVTCFNRNLGAWIGKACIGFGPGGSRDELNARRAKHLEASLTA